MSYSDYLESVGQTTQRRHDTLWTVWRPATSVGVTFKSIYAAKSYALMCTDCVAIVGPLYSNSVEN